jgi:hypothetical protein
MKTFRIRMLATIAMVGLALPTLAQQLPELSAATAYRCEYKREILWGSISGQWCELWQQF